ncbi:MAG: ATP-binding protein [Gemmatimonadales bacterium]
MAQASFPPTVELDAAVLLAAITLGLALVCGQLYRLYRKPYLGWWALAWLLYLLRVGAIASFLATHRWAWLYWHQVLTGWTALALLWASLVFSRQFEWRWRYAALPLFPAAWSYVAIYRLDNFLLAAGPAVLFLSLVTLWTGWTFVRYYRRVRATGAALLAGALLLWGLHHLDYPFLRARGAWSPWGYYLDILFLLATGAGILVLVQDELRRGLAALSTLSGDLQLRPDTAGDLGTLLERPLALPAVRGSAMIVAEHGQPRCVAGAGACAGWEGQALAARAAEAAAQAITDGRPAFIVDWPDPRPGGRDFPYAALLPVLRGETVTGVLVLVGDARDPFTALDEGFLRALGSQIGAALENADLYRRLESRTAELARLSTRIVEQQEAERRRLSLELHDETAQVLAAVKLQLGLLAERLDPTQAAELAHTVGLIDAGIRSVRRVTEQLRPTLLDDLGLVPALRSLSESFGERAGIAVALDSPEALPTLTRDAELAVFRATQEALANVAQHAAAQHVRVRLGDSAGRLTLVIADDGRGLPVGFDLARTERDGHLGLAGMRERIGALGGTIAVSGAPGAGVCLLLEIPYTVIDAA